MRSIFIRFCTLIPCLWFMSTVYHIYTNTQAYCTTNSIHFGFRVTRSNLATMCKTYVFKIALALLENTSRPRIQWIPFVPFSFAPSHSQIRARFNSNAYAFELEVFATVTTIRTNDTLFPSRKWLPARSNTYRTLAFPILMVQSTLFV